MPSHHDVGELRTERVTGFPGFIHVIQDSVRWVGKISGGRTEEIFACWLTSLVVFIRTFPITMGKVSIFCMVLAMVLTSICADMMRKSIVFDEKNPKHFYCPQEKPKGMNKMIVKARPIDKLCEFEGRPPKEFKSDCYNDIDESDYACAEKERIMMRLNPPNDTETTTMSTTTAKTYLKTKPKKQ